MKVKNFKIFVPVIVAALITQSSSFTLEKSNREAVLVEPITLTKEYQKVMKRR